MCIACHTLEKELGRIAIAEHRAEGVGDGLGRDREGLLEEGFGGSDGIGDLWRVRGGEGRRAYDTRP